MPSFAQLPQRRVCVPYRVQVDHNLALFKGEEDEHEKSHRFYKKLVDEVSNDVFFPICWIVHVT